MGELSSFPSAKKPPEHLYHYTSIEGVMGILDKRSLWASQIHFLNDSQEFKYALRIFEKVLAELQGKIPKKTMWERALEISSNPTTVDKNDISTIIYGSLKNFVLAPVLEKSPICVFSFSEEGDILSQWRGYCPPRGGYSFGFRSDALMRFLEIHNLHLLPCIYDKTKQEAIIEKEISEFHNTIAKKWTGHEAIDKFISEIPVVDFFIEFSKIASVLKHSSFDEEKEWRIVSGLIPNRNMEFRIIKSMILPYFPISFSDFEPFLIDEIIIGPSPEQSLAESSLMQFILKKNLNISIKTSKIPYREF
jgi:hypothetical protein